MAPLLLGIIFSQGAVHRLYYLLAHLGGFGLLIFSAIDSSPLLMPLGNDLLMIALTAKQHSLLVYYALMATLGSVFGCLTVDVLSRKGGEKGLKTTVPPRQLNFIKRRIKNNAAWTLALASLMPPPFPFTPFVAAAAAFQYPRKKIMLVLSLSRLARFLIEGVLAIWFGRRLLRFARSPIVAYIIAMLIVVSVAGSGLAIRSWIKRSKTLHAAG